MPEAIDGEIVDVEHRALAVRPETPQVPGLFGVDDPDEFIERAVKHANALKKIIDAKGLSKNLGRGGDEYIEYEGWTTLGGMVKVFPFTEWTREVEGGYEARVVVKNTFGVEIGAAEAICTRKERNWANRDDYALKSMAQTRAGGKALRTVLGFIAVLAGYKATPADEMPRESQASAPPRPTQAQAPKPSPSEAPPAAGGSLFDDERPPEPAHDDQAAKRAVFARLTEHDADTRLNANDRMRLYMTAAGVANRTNLKSLDAAKRVLAAYENAFKDLNEADAALETAMQSEIPL